MNKIYSVFQGFLGKILFIVIISFSLHLFAMEENVKGLNKALQTKVFANDLDGTVAVIKNFHKQLLSLKSDYKRQEKLCDLLFEGLVEKVLGSKNINLNLAVFVLEGAGYITNDFLKLKRQMPLFLLNSKLCEKMFNDAGVMIARKELTPGISFVLLSKIGEIYHATSNHLAKLFLKDESDLSSVIAKRYQQASTERFEPGVIEAIDTFCQKAFFDRFLARAVNLLYEAKNDSEFIKSLVILITLLKASSEDVLTLVARNLDVSKITLFKDDTNKFSNLCDQEHALKFDEFLENPELSSISQFMDRLNELLGKAVSDLEENKSSVPEDFIDIINLVQDNIINYMFIPIFGRFQSKRCFISINEILNLAGTMILDSNKFEKYIPSTRLIDIKPLRSDKFINSVLNRLATQLIYVYLKSNVEFKEIIRLLIRIGNRGFAPQSVIHHFMQAAAILVKEDKDLSIKKKVRDIMQFINANVQKYKFDKYQDLMDQYVRTYELIDLIKAESKNERSIILLLNKGVQINMLDFDDKSPLIYAIESENPNYVKLFIEKGANVNLVGWDGATPIIMAILDKNIDIIKLLLKYGADLALQNIYGQNVWSLAKGHPEIEQLLKTAITNIKQDNQVNLLSELSSSLNSLSLR